MSECEWARSRARAWRGNKQFLCAWKITSFPSSSFINVNGHIRSAPTGGKGKFGHGRLRIASVFQNRKQPAMVSAKRGSSCDRSPHPTKRNFLIKWSVFSLVTSTRKSWGFVVVRECDHNEVLLFPSDAEFNYIDHLMSVDHKVDWLIWLFADSTPTHGRWNRNPE